MLNHEAYEMTELEGKVAFWKKRYESLREDIIELIVAWEKRAETEDNGVYPGEYFQPASPSAVCADELKRLIK